MCAGVGFFWGGNASLRGRCAPSIVQAAAYRRASAVARVVDIFGWQRCRATPLFAASNRGKTKLSCYPECLLAFANRRLSELLVLRWFALRQFARRTESLNELDGMPCI